MKKVKKPCVVIKLDCNTFDFRAPRYSCYNNKHIKGLVPCAEINGKFYDLRTTEQVEPGPEDRFLVWQTFPGTVFEYPDGKRFILTRMIAGRELAFIEIAPEQFNPISMSMHKVLV